MDAPDDLKRPQPIHLTQREQEAPLSQRVHATLIDAILLPIYAYVLFLGIFALWIVVTGTPPTRQTHPEETVLWLWVGVLGVSVWLYFTLLECSHKQGTWGKTIVGLRVTDLEGRRISYWQSALRQWGKLVSVIGFPVTILMMMFGNRRQAPHDQLAGTVVVEVTGSYRRRVPDSLDTSPARGRPRQAPPDGNAGIVWLPDQMQEPPSPGS